jgi:REP element-mobilizing transposase RayT
MEKKEFYRKNLPHYQQAGQAYFITWCLKDAVPPKALESYTIQLLQIKSEIQIAQKNQLDVQLIEELKLKLRIIRNKYMKAFDDLLHLQTKTIIDLSKVENTRIMLNALRFWEGKRLDNYAICVMSNHIHWVLKVYDKNEKGEPNWLQDILQSVKRFTANEINKQENKKGTVWQSESFDTTIRDNEHLHNAINYTLQNPVSARLVKNWGEWKGTYYCEGEKAGCWNSGCRNSDSDRREREIDLLETPLSLTDGIGVPSS